MPDDIAINCAADIANLFTRAQHDLSKSFDAIEGLDPVWDSGKIPDAGAFPLNSGFAARVTVLGQQRLSFTNLNLWKNMVGLQPDCVTSCDPPTTTLNQANADHKWYRLMHVSYNTVPYCLESMFAESLNLEEQIAQIFWNLKHVTMDLMDEFYRNNHAAITKNRWNGYDDGATQSLQKGNWRFASNADGDVDTTYIILDPTISPDNLAVLSIPLLNRIRNRGIYVAAFPKTGMIPLVTDYETFQDLPLYDTNTRADNRHRAPDKLNPAFASIQEYGNFSLDEDPFSLRYYWTETEPGYPDGVLKRIDHWSSLAFSEGCMSDISDDYENADFQVSFPWGKPAFHLQSGEQPLSAGSGVTFADPASPWNGMWRWVNGINEITPCNVDLNKGFWRMVAKKAARPFNNGLLSHSVLHRRFPFRGITKSCKPLGTPAGGSVDCALTCPPLDHYPPALVDVFTCGAWNDDACALT